MIRSEPARGGEPSRGRRESRRKSGRLPVGIKDLPVQERPRERLLASGPGVLSSIELLAVLLGTGHRQSGASALDLAMRVSRYADRFGENLQGLARIQPEDLCRIPGVGPAKAARVAAAVELGRRVAEARSSKGPVVIGGPDDVAGLVGAEMRPLRREHFRLVLVNTRNHVLGVQTISIGGQDQTTVDAREVFRTAIGRGAAGVILVHNHPSGDPTPSPEDLAVTRRLVEAGRVVGISVLDHVVIGDQQHVSLRERYPGWFGG